MKLFANITKRDDEQRMVWGYASTEAVDSQGEIVKLDAIKGAWDDYMRFANIREMHQPSAVGKCKEFEFDDKGVMIGVKVVDDPAWTKVVEGVYSGFSIGGKAISKMNGVITQLQLTEISLVDRPANPEALITVWKGEAIEQEQPAEQPADEQPAVEKGLWTAARIAETIDTMRALQQVMAQEEAREGEEPGLPDELKAHVVALVDLLSRYVGKQAEEIAEGTDKADGAGDVQKAGARFSKSVKAELAEIHDMMRKCDHKLTKMGYADAEEDEDEAKAAVLVDIAKAMGLGDEQDPVAAVAKMTEDLAAARARIEELEKQPETPKAALNDLGIEKGRDGSNAGDPALAEIQSKAEAGTLTPADLVKFIHTNGGRRLA